MNDTLLAELIKFLFFLITLVVTIAAPPLLYKLFRWLGMNEQQAKVAAEQTQELAERMKVRNLLVGVEEWAAVKIKAAKLSGEDHGINAKVKAEEFLTRAAEEGLSLDKAAKFAQQELPKIGLGAAGAAASTVVNQVIQGKDVDLKAVAEVALQEFLKAGFQYTGASNAGK